MQGDDAGRLRLLIDSVIDYAIYVIDLDGRVASWNSGAARLKGYCSEEIIGQPFDKFFTPEDQARELPQNALATAPRSGRFEHRLLAFSRRQPLDPKVLDLNDYLPGVADFLQHSLGETIEIEVSGAAGL